jgi:cyanate permease
MKDALVVLMLFVFVGIGVANVFKPEWFVKRSSVRRGGEMLSEYNRAGFQIAGAIFAALAIYMLYSFFRH